MSGSAKQLRVAIVGASGYTGAELVRLLSNHPAVQLSALTADRKAGQPIGTIFPHLLAVNRDQAFPDVMVSVDDVSWSEIDFAFLALPHGTAQAVVKALPTSVNAIDLSPDFRFTDPSVYQAWYGQPHQAVELQREAVYGLTELAREDIKGARLIGCPGCYPTSVLLPLAPLLEAHLIDPDEVIIDAKSGVSGAGRALKETSLYTEVAEGIHAYGVASHRHVPEIEQLASRAAGRSVVVNFTPHLMPMNRGILSTIYTRLAPNTNANGIRQHLSERFANEPFVTVLPEGQVPATRHVRGSNHCVIGVFADRIPGRAIIISVIDNLMKGASGQAVQNMNLIAGLPETMGLEHGPLFP